MEETRRAADRAADAALVERISAGDEAAFGELYDRWVDRVHALATRIAGRDEASDVTQEVFLAAWRNLGTLRDPASFGGWLLRTTRNRALDVSGRATRTRPTDVEGFEMIERAGPSGADVPAGFGVEDSLVDAQDPAAALERSEVADLVWSSVAALGERDATVLDLTLRHGLAPAEVADVVGTNRNAANQMLHRARTRLGDSVRARVLWQGGRPRCDQLADDLERRGITTFGPDAVRAATAHAESCEACDERRRLRLAPAALFGAIPIAVLDAGVREQIASALAIQGVPLAGSSTGGSQVPDGPTGSNGTDPSASPVSAGTPSEAVHAKTWTRMTAGAVAVLTILAIVTFVLGRDGDEEPAAAHSDVTVTSTSVASSTTTTVATEAPAVAPPATDPVVPAAPAPADGAPSSESSGVQAPPPAAAPVVSFGIVPGSPDSTWTTATAPRLAWSVVGGAEVEISGPGVASAARSGEVPLCPTEPPGWTVCPFVAGSWTYTVRVIDDAGSLIAQETAVLVRP